jgi:mevalonate pyrophosphate decarboxylase
MSQVEELSYTLSRIKNNANNDLILQGTTKEQEIERLQFTLKTFKDKNEDL